MQRSGSRKSDPMERNLISDEKELGDEEREFGEKGKSGIFAIMLTDLEGFTEFTANLSKDAVSEFVRNHEEKIREIVERFGGVVVKFLGDGSICVFRSLERAFEAGRILQSEFGMRKPRMKIFLHIGEVVFDENDSDVYGFDVNFAFRMIEALKGGAFAVSDPVYHLLGKKEDFSSSPELWVKGVSHPVRIHFYRGDKKAFSETDDVKILIRNATLLQRVISFYLDVMIFLGTFGILSGFILHNIFKSKGEEVGKGKFESSYMLSKMLEKEGIHSSTSSEGRLEESSEDEIETRKGEKEEEKKKTSSESIIEFQAPFGEVKAGKEGLKLKFGEGEIKTAPGELEVKMKGKKLISFTFLKIGGFEIVFLILYFALFWYFGKGKTPGEWLVQIKVERNDGSPPDLKTSFLRAFLFVIFVLPAGLGIIISYLISRKLPHDSITGTRVVATSSSSS